MSHYGETDDIQALESEVGVAMRRKNKSRPVSICNDCPKAKDCHMNNGVRQDCNHKRIFMQDLV